MDDPADPLGFWLAANSADNMKEGLTGKAPTAAWDGVTNVAPLVGMTAATALPPGTSPRPRWKPRFRPGCGRESSLALRMR